MANECPDPEPEPEPEPDAETIAMGEVIYPALDGPASGEVGENDNDNGSLGIVGSGLIFEEA